VEAGGNFLPAKPSRRLPSKRRNPPRRKRPHWKTRVVVIGCLLIFGLLAWAVIARRLAPRSNTSLTRFDAIIVLGTPTDDDGNPTPTELASVTEAVHEYERGVAPRLIFSGGPAHNQFGEARVMARAARAQGIPESAIFVEPEARDTIQNACYSVRIMKAHGWRSAEVVSAANHLPRASLIFSRLPLQWRMQASPPVAVESPTDERAMVAKEILKTMRYLVWTRQTERCEP
jgi:uncharacterized SAM-binding protein YcdF (DUF218 family)